MDKTNNPRQNEKTCLALPILFLVFFILLAGFAAAQKQWEVDKFEDLPSQMEFSSEAEFKKALSAVNDLYFDYLEREYGNTYVEVSPSLYPSYSLVGMNFRIDVDAFGEITEEEKILVKKVIETEKNINEIEKKISETNKLFKTTNAEYNYLIAEIDKLEKQLKDEEEVLGNLLSCDLLGADKDCNGNIALSDLTDYISLWIQGDELIGVEEITQQISNWIAQPTQTIESSTPTQDSLIASYDFDNNETLAFDSSGKENNGVASNVQSVVSEIKFNAVNFNGQNSIIEIPHSVDFNFGSEAFTLALWFKLSNETIEGARHIAGKREATGGNWFRVYYLDNEVFFEITGGENIKSNKEEFIQVIEAGEWYFVTATRDSSGIAHLYLDGVKIAERSMPGEVSNSATFTIGKWGGESSFNGIIDEVRVWNKALAEDEIKGIYGNEVSLEAV